MNRRVKINDVESKPNLTLHPAPLPLRERQRLMRESAILDAAHALIADRGYDAMTMDELADRVGISKPTLYQHFPSKEAIAVRAVLLRMEGCLDYIRAVDRSLPAAQRLRRVVAWVVNERFAHGQTAFGAAKSALVPVVRAYPEYREAYGQMVAAVSAMVEEAKADGDISPTLCTRPIVQMVFSVVRDAEYEELIARGECSADEVTETIVRVFFGGVTQQNNANQSGDDAASNQN